MKTFNKIIIYFLLLVLSSCNSSKHEPLSRDEMASVLKQTIELIINNTNEEMEDTFYIIDQIYDKNNTTEHLVFSKSIYLSDFKFINKYDNLKLIDYNKVYKNKNIGSFIDIYFGELKEDTLQIGLNYTFTGGDESFIVQPEIVLQEYYVFIKSSNKWKYKYRYEP